MLMLKEEKIATTKLKEVYSGVHVGVKLHKVESSKSNSSMKEHATHKCNNEAKHAALLPVNAKIASLFNAEKG